MSAFIDVLAQIATFAEKNQDLDDSDQDWFKTTLVDLGALEQALEVLWSLKLIVDQLELAKLFNS